MNDTQKLCFIISQCTYAIIEAWGMQAENTHRLDCGNSIAYGDEAFFNVADKYLKIGDELRQFLES